MTPPTPAEAAKAAAAKRAAALVEPGMRVGLGTGSTAAWLLRFLGRRVREDGLRITGVPTSARTADAADAEGIPLATLDEARFLDLAIDGADEVDPGLDLIKGGGGALLREKIVATASERVVIIADAGKRVDALGAFPLPVEVVRFGWATTQGLIEEALTGLGLGGRGSTVRTADGAPVVTDEGHHILDLTLRGIPDPRALAHLLNQIPGVVDTGLFLGLCDLLVVGHGDGRVEVTDRATGRMEEGRVRLAPDNVFTDVSD